jgi:hypothetical protein
MRRLPLAALTGLSLALAALGHPAELGQHADGCRTDSPPLPPAVPGPIEPDVASLPPDLPQAVTSPPRYRLLHEGDTQCRAVRSASIANLLDREREQMARAHPSHGTYRSEPPPKDARAWSLRRSVLYYAALDDRNRAAGQALPLYFKAAELEAQIGLLQLSRDDLAGAIRKSDELSKKGFRLPTDAGALRRQLLDTETDLVRARAGLAEVNGRLKELIGACDMAPDEWLWPAIEVPVTFEPVDAEPAVAVAMMKRPELLLLRDLAHDPDAQTVPVIREYLHGVSGLVGAGPIKLLAALKAASDGEKDLREGQVKQLLVDRERAVADEVRRAVADLNAKSRLVAISRDRVLSADEHRRDAEQKAERAGGSFLEVLTAHLDWYRARSRLTQDVMAWHTARAKAREAEGVFVWECGACGQP